MKKKVVGMLCACWMVGCVAFGAAPAVVTDGQRVVYTRDNGSTLTIMYPQVSVPENEMASRLIMQYFVQEQQKATDFFNKDITDDEIMTEEKSYEVTLNNGKYLSIIDKGYLNYDRAAHPSSWKNGVVFDVETGKQLDWQDIIRPEDEKAFSLKNINNKIFLSDYRLSAFFNGLTELPKNYYLDKNQTIHFLFQQYEIAPYAAGIIDISMGKKAK